MFKTEQFFSHLHLKYGKRANMTQKWVIKKLKILYWFDADLKVPKREIFDRSDFPDFYTIQSSWVGDLLVNILTYYFNFWES